MATTHLSGPLVVAGAATIGGATGITGAVTVTGGITASTTINAGSSMVQGGAGGATPASTAKAYCRYAPITKTAIANNTATDVVTVTVPNASHAAAFKVFILTTLTGAGTFQSSRVAEYNAVLTRIAGAAVVVTLSSVIGAAQATSSGGATITSTTLTASAITGAVGATNTFTFVITNVTSGSEVSQTTVVIEGLNSEATGISIAAA